MERMAEEYFYYNTVVWNHPRNHDADEKPGYAGGNDITYIKPKNMTQYLGKMANPYRYGYMFEINNAASAEGEELVKHYVTGRLSHETAAIMPDMKTIYMSDDDSAKYNDKVYNTSSGGVLFKFVADIKGDLSSGSLYAAKLTQDGTSDPHKPGFNVDWVMLGKSNHAQAGSWIAEYDDVKVSDYVEGQSSYISNEDINNWAEGKTGKEKFPSNGKQVDEMTITDFWKWYGSDLVNNALRGNLAEYIVGLALGQQNKIQEGWAAWDLTYTGIKIEVKSSGYIQRSPGRILT